MAYRSAYGGYDSDSDVYEVECTFKYLSVDQKLKIEFDGDIVVSDCNPRKAASSRKSYWEDDFGTGDDYWEDCNERTRGRANHGKFSQKMPVISAIVRAPSDPGVYKYSDAYEDLYVGKSKNLNVRHKDHMYGQNQDIDDYLKDNELDTFYQYKRTPTAEDARKEEKRLLEAYKKKNGRLPKFNKRL